MEHVTVYREPGRYAGWPANYGIWSWGDEIVVGFAVGRHDPAGGFHTRDRTKPFVTMQARSTDGGRSWTASATPCRIPGNKALSADEHVDGDLRIGCLTGAVNAPVECPGGIDFAHPDFALMCARTGLRAGAVSWFYYSYDRCRTCQGPFSLPLFGQSGIAARTDYAISSPGECTLFLTAAKSNGQEGRPFAARTVDAGKRFEFLSWIGEEPKGYGIMPAGVRLSADRMVVAVRCQESGRNWIDLWESEDNGRSWRHLTTPVPNTGDGGNPPAMIRLRDGRLCLTYGYRGAPYGMRARLSEDGGRSWGGEIVLRDDGGNHDLGYACTVQRADGKVVTAYYFNDRPAGDRYIAATIWQP